MTSGNVYLRRKKPASHNQRKSGSKNRAGGHPELLAWLADFRIEHDYTWAKLAELCGCARPTLFLAVRRKRITDRVAGRILRAFGDEKGIPGGAGVRKPGARGAKDV